MCAICKYALSEDDVGVPVVIKYIFKKILCIWLGCI